MAEPLHVGLVLLAAGAARRMGRLKQLLPVEGRPLVRHVAERLLPAGLAPVVVVLGAQAEEVREALAGLPVHPVVNPDWKEGMGASLRTGVAEALRLQPEISGVIIALADQPDLDAGHLGRILTEQRNSGRSIVAWLSGGVPMPPVYFGAGHFSRLLVLPGDSGARQMLRSASSEMAFVSGQSLPDLDTQYEYEEYLKRGPVDMQMDG